MSLDKGYVQIYTGGGKGKTTAALGLALRAAGAGLKVYIAQFAKGSETGELAALKKFSRQITIRQFGTRSFIKTPSKMECTLAAKGLAVAGKIIQAGKHDVVILDELCGACAHRLIPVYNVVSLVKNRPGHVEIVLTGRKAPAKLLRIADLVTEMKDVRHYYVAGVKARKGIEF